MLNLNLSKTLRKTVRAGSTAAFALLSTLAVSAQSSVQTPSPFDPLSHPTTQSSPLSQPTLTPGVLLLLELEGRFAQAVATGGGKAFASWFADDALTLSNGLAPVLGRTSIAANANWDPKVYQLTWVPQGAQMGPSNDMGFTWGHYEGRSKDKNGQPVVTSGRYFTVWKKLPDGNWKVAMDASANEPPAAGECCTLPKP
jgi:ketosteroid isomerase-like protein